MKLNDFFEKKKVKKIKKEPTTFNLNNDELERKLGDRINDLEERLKIAHEGLSEADLVKRDYDEILKISQEREGAISRLQSEFDSQSTSLDMLRNKVSTLEEYQDKFNVLDRRHNSSLSEIHNLKKDLNEGKKNFDVLQKEFFNCRENRSKAEAKNTKLDYELKELIDNFKILESNNINSQNLLLNMKNKYEEVVNDNKSLEMDCQALLNDNRSARLKIEELDSFKVQLNEWNKKLTINSEEATSKSSALNKKLNQRDEIIKDMNAYLENIVNDKNDLNFPGYISFKIYIKMHF